MKKKKYAVRRNTLVSICLHAVIARRSWVDHYLLQKEGTPEGTLLASQFARLPAQLFAKVLSQAIRKNLLNDETAFLFLNESLVNLKLSGVTSNISEKTIARIASICTNLKTISLYSVTNAPPESLMILFKSLPQLEGVNLAKCPVANEHVLTSLACSCTGLKSLILNRDQLVGDSVLLQMLPKLPLLVEIGLLGCVMVTDVSILQMAKTNTSLTTLNASKCGYTGQSLIPLVEACPGLIQLNIARTKMVTDSVLDAIAASLGGTLLSINLAYCSGFTEKGLASFLQKCTALREVDLPISTSFVLHSLIESSNPIREVILSRGSPANKDIFIALADAFPNLMTLWASKCRGITDESLGALLRKCNKLNELYVSSDLPAQTLSPAAFAEITPNSLKILELNQCANAVTDENILIIGQNCPKMQDLQIAGCTLTEKGYTRLCDHFPKLQHLNLTKTNTTDAIVRMIATSVFSHNLRSLALSECPVTEACFPIIFSSMPSLFSLDVCKCQNIGSGRPKKFLQKKKRKDEKGKGKNKVREKEKEIDDREKGKVHDQEDAKEVTQTFPKMPQLIPDDDSFSDSRHDTPVESALNSLFLASCVNMTPDVLHKILSYCPHLQILRLAACVGLEGLSPESSEEEKQGHYGLPYESLLHMIASQLPELHSIDVSFLPECIEDQGAIYLAKHCLYLDYINFSKCPRIGDNVVEAIFSHCVFLQTLHVAHCTRITDNSVGSLLDEKRGCGQLQLLSVTQSGVSAGLILKLQAKYPHLQIHFLQPQPKVPKKGAKKTSLAEWQKMQEHMRAEEEQRKRFNDFNYWKMPFEFSLVEEDDEENPNKGK